jgi:uncharacterized protein with HEPN domain
MRSERRIKWLNDIVRNCDAVDSFVLGLSKNDFDSDLKTVNAVLYCLLTIGEAAKRLDADEKAHGVDVPLDRLYPDTPWRDIRGMANAVRHEYDSLDFDLIWTTAKEFMTPLRDVVRVEIRRLEQVVGGEKPDDDAPPTP